MDPIIILDSDEEEGRVSMPLSKVDGCSSSSSPSYNKMFNRTSSPASSPLHSFSSDRTISDNLPISPRMQHRMARAYPFRQPQGDLIIPDYKSCYNEIRLVEVLNSFTLFPDHTYRAPLENECIGGGREGEVTVYLDSMKGGLRFPLHPFLVEFLCFVNLNPAQLAPNSWRILVYFLIVCLNNSIHPSLNLLRCFTELKQHRDYNSLVVFNTKNDFRIPNCPSSQPGWKTRFFYAKRNNGPFPFPISWNRPNFGIFNNSIALSEAEEEAFLTIQTYDPYARHMKEVLTDAILIEHRINYPEDEMSFNFDKVNALLKSKAKGKGVKRKASDKNFISDPPVDNPTDRVTPTPTLTHPPTPIRSLSNPQPGGQETSSRSKVRVDEDVDAISDALDHVLLDDMKKKSGTAIHRAFSVEMRRVLTMERALLDSLEVTSKSYAEVVNANSQLERELIETKKLLAQKDKSLGEKDLLMSSMREEYERKLESCGREAVEAYKVSSDFDEVAGMYGVKSMIHAYRKVKEWLQQDHPEIDLSEFESFADAEALDDELEQGDDASQRSPPPA